jgi:hypothetical protein
VHSEHVARVIDVGALPGGEPYVVMEYLEGDDLADVLARRGPLPVATAVGYVLEACEALAEAHALGIVHRDLKPANLFLATRSSGPPIVKVLDFGISKSTVPASEGQLTKTSAVMGSPLYISPEQIASARTVDVRSDVWALGVVLFELLSATLPFMGETLTEVIAAVLQRDHVPLRAARSDVPAALEAVVHRCLMKDPATRFASVAELAVALAPFGPARGAISIERISHVMARLGAGPTGPAERTPLASTPPLALTAKPVSTDRRPPRPLSRQGRALAAATGLLVLAAAGAVAVWRLAAPPAVGLVSVGPLPGPASTGAPSGVPSPVVAATAADPVVSAAPRGAGDAGAVTLPETRAVEAPGPARGPASPPRSAPRASPPRPATVAASVASAPTSAPASTSVATPASAPSTPVNPCRTVSYLDGSGQKHFKQVCP